MFYILPVKKQNFSNYLAELLRAIWHIGATSCPTDHGLSGAVSRVEKCELDTFY